ncbi:plasmid mobilization relaxosome protein MobC [Gordonia paraffinivorans]|uniref:plasmid mobilization relaxosome protein MobC n=1 Tax=Gordonia paraffinivorans TaxID=175628 RepID=UPI001E29BA4D|nr:plasmid mobilization relaxosome protein MobC [Gordonia paraffinivorans]MCD2143721.1 MobC family plasmid mobilization relaxosome protein [Gordonia paraffinivorans]
MTDSGSAGEAAAAAVDLDKLAVGVAEAVTGPKGTAVAEAAVAQALRRRAAGASFRDIGAQLRRRPDFDAVSDNAAAKAVSQWCRVAEQLEPAFCGRIPTSPTKARTKGPVRSVRLPADLDEQVRLRARGRPIGVAMEELIAIGVGRRPPTQQRLFKARRRKALGTALGNAHEGTTSVAHQLSRIGANLNQLAMYANQRRELPFGVADELALIRREMRRITREVTSIRAALEHVVEKG